MINSAERLPLSNTFIRRQNMLEKENIILSIWRSCDENDCFSDDILSPNKKKQTILHLCIQSRMYKLFEVICSSKHLNSRKRFEVFNDAETTPLKQIHDEFAKLGLRVDEIEVVLLESRLSR